MIKTILKLAVIWLMPLTAMAAEYEAGTHYKVLDRPIKSNSDAIIVNQFLVTPVPTVMPLYRLYIIGLSSKAIQYA